MSFAPTCIVAAPSWQALTASGVLLSASASEDDVRAAASGMAASRSLDTLDPSWGAYGADAPLGLTAARDSYGSVTGAAPAPAPPAPWWAQAAPPPPPAPLPLAHPALRSPMKRDRSLGGGLDVHAFSHTPSLKADVAAEAKRSAALAASARLGLNPDTLMDVLPSIPTRIDTPAGPVRLAARLWRCAGGRVGARVSGERAVEGGRAPSPANDARLLAHAMAAAFMKPATVTTGQPQDEAAGASAARAFSPCRHHRAGSDDALRIQEVYLVRRDPATAAPVELWHLPLRAARDGALPDAPDWPAAAVVDVLARLPGDEGVWLRAGPLSLPAAESPAAAA